MLRHAISTPAARVQMLTGKRVYEILKNLSDDDCRLLGLDPKWARPDWMMITVMPVPPPHVRPAIEMDSTGRCEDDLTHHLSSIIRDNQALRAHMASGSPEHVLKVLTTHLSCVSIVCSQRRSGMHWLVRRRGS